jgi:hypothetical protein
VGHFFNAARQPCTPYSFAASTSSIASGVLATSRIRRNFSAFGQTPAFDLADPEPAPNRVLVGRPVGGRTPRVADVSRRAPDASPPLRRWLEIGRHQPLALG